MIINAVTFWLGREQLDASYDVLQVTESQRPDLG